MELDNKLHDYLKELSENWDDYNDGGGTPITYEQAKDKILSIIFTSTQLAALADGGHIEVATKGRPKIVCLCGSTKFKQDFIEANFRFTMKGYIVLTVGWFSHTDGLIFTPSPEEKKSLDELHKRKIDLADEVFVINKGGYIGESTRSEINYAIALGKPIEYLESIEAHWMKVVGK